MSFQAFLVHRLLNPLGFAAPKSELHFVAATEPLASKLPEPNYNENKILVPLPVAV